jgi:ADP-ribose pyrophosphatase YjhB (NUDIX family)
MIDNIKNIYNTRSSNPPRFSQTKEDGLTQEINALSGKRDAFIKQINVDIVQKARELKKLTGKSEPIRLATLGFRKIEGALMGDTGVYEYMRNRSDYSAVIVPIVQMPVVEQGKTTLQDHVVFITANEHALNGKSTISFPGGFIADEDPSETELKACLRELKEETSYEAGKLRVLDRVVYAPRSSREYMTIAVAEHLKRLKGDHRDDAEKLANLSTVVVPLNKVNEWLDQKRKEGMEINAHVEMALRRYEREKKRLDAAV